MELARSVLFSFSLFGSVVEQTCGEMRFGALAPAWGVTWGCPMSLNTITLCV